MRFRSALPTLLLGAVVACSESTPTPAALDGPPVTVPVPARERLAARLAVALDDPAVRASLADRFAHSHAPEGKLQFQALVRTADRQLLARLASVGGGTMAELLADLDAARGLELYLPVPAHREAWHGGEEFLVATLEHDGERPVAFDAAGRRSLLDADRPPATPVLALVPQEFDFTGGRPELALACWDACGVANNDLGASGGGSVGTKGLYLVATHFEDDFESWLKGSPEYEFHVYGEVSGDAEQLSCTGEHAGGVYTWDTNARDWRGSVALLSETDIQLYTARSSKDVVRIVAWEDDDTACVPVADGDYLTSIVKALDTFFQKWTGARVKPTLPKGIEAAYAAYGLARAARNVILTSDDLIGHGVEASIAGWAPGGANFVLKGDGARTTGWFETVYRK